MSTFSTSREFIPGTTGWTADDLSDPEIARLWEAGAYEIVEGVLTLMPPAYHDGTLALNRLRRIIERHLDDKRIAGEFTTEDDVVLGPRRVVRVDMMFMTPHDHQRQEQANAARGRSTLRYGRILVPPTLIVEAVSIGHEDHDRDVKRVWFAEAGVPSYWILHPFQRTLECLILRQGVYEIDVRGARDEVVSPTIFPGVTIPLANLWA
jgi:Uma2 family endonuclease